MKTFTSRKRYNIYSLITLIVILLSFGYYYFFYIPQQETRFHKQGFRIIEKIGENTSEQAENYHEIMINYLNRNVSADNLFYNKQRKQAEEQNYDIEKYELPDGLYIAESELLWLSGKFSTNNIIEYKVNIDELDVSVESTREERVTYHIDIPKLFQGKLRNDFFKSYLVFDESRIYYSDIPVASNELSLDSLRNKQAIMASTIINIEFDNEMHQMYVVPVNFSNGVTIFLGGIIDNQFFRKQTHSLNPNAVSIVLIFLSLFVLALPLMKLMLISESERFKTFDAFLALLTIIVGAAFLIQLLLYNYLSSGPLESHREDLLKQYSNAISKDLVEEIKLGLKIMEDCDRALNDSSGKYVISPSDPYPYDNLYVQPDNIPVYKDGLIITWLSPHGDQLVKWSTKTITPRTNVGDRDYLTRTINRQLWHLEGSGSNDGFYIDYIQSKTQGSVYAMMSRESNVGVLDHHQGVSLDFISKEDSNSFKAGVVALGLDFHVLNKLKTMDNISYMLVSGDGTVLSHKDKSRDLQENIIEECDRDHQLLEALYGKKERTFRAYYNSGMRLFHIKSIDRLPLYLLVYLDNDYEKLSDIQVLTLSSELYVMLMFIFLLQVMLFSFINRKRHLKTKGNRIYFDWIWPKPGNRYLYLIFSLIMLISYLIYYIAGLYQNLFHILSVVIIMITTIMVVLKQVSTKKIRNKRYMREAYAILLSYYLAFNGLAVVIFHSVLDIDKISYLGFYIILFLSVLMVTGNAIGLFDSKDVAGANEAQKDRRGFLFWLGNISGFNFHYYKNSYNIYLLCLVFALGFLPSIDSFVKAYRIEKELYMRNCQYSLIRNADPEGEIEDAAFCYRVPAVKGEKLDTDDHEVPAEYLVKGRERTLINLFRYSLNDDKHNASVLSLLNDPHAGSVYWKQNDGKLEMISPLHKTKISSPQYLRLGNHFGNTGSIIYWIYIVLAFFLVVIIFKLLDFWLRKVFLVDIDKIGLIKPSDALEDSMFVYIISPALNKTREFLKQKKYCQHEINLMNLGDKKFLQTEIDVLDDKYIASNRIRVKGFNIVVVDSDPHDKNSFDGKSRIVSRLMKLVEDLPSVRLIIISTSHPAFYSNIFKDKPDDVNLSDNIMKGFKAYVNMLGPFLRTYFPVEIEPHIIEQKLDRYGIFKSYSIDKNLNTRKQEECFLEDEDKIIQLQVESQNYFYSLWNNLEVREQYLVYDIAQNGLINYKNLPIIYNLLNKGILKRDEHNKLVLFCHSFRNFILSIVDTEQALRIESIARRSGNWSNLRLPLIMIFIAAFALLFIAEQDVFNNMIGWLLAASASIPILMRTFMSISSVWPGGKDKGPTST